MRQRVTPQKIFVSKVEEKRVCCFEINKFFNDDKLCSAMMLEKRSNGYRIFFVSGECNWFYGP